MNKVHFTTLTLSSLQQWAHTTGCVKKNLSFSEVIAKALVRGIDDKLCLSSRRQII
jgi:hypothetical protein